MSSPQFDPVPMAPPGGAGSASAPPAPEPAEQQSNPIRDAIAEAIAEHDVILFMKGTPEAPACGFSARTVAILQSLDTPFAAVDILPDPRIRQELSALSELAHDPAAVRGRRAGRRLRHRHRDVRVGRARAGPELALVLRAAAQRAAARAAPAVRYRARSMRPVAVVSDSTHYLPRALADEHGIHQVSLYVGWQGQPVRELDMDGFDAFYERLRTDPELPTTSQPSIGDFLEVWEPLLEDGHDVVSVHLAGGISGTVEAARQAHGLLVGARRRRSRRGDRRRNRLRRARPAGAGGRGRGPRREPTRRPRSSGSAARSRCCGSGSAWTRWSTCAAAGGSARRRRGWAGR